MLVGAETVTGTAMASLYTEQLPLERWREDGGNGENGKNGKNGGDGGGDGGRAAAHGTAGAALRGTGRLGDSDGIAVY